MEGKRESILLYPKRIFVRGEEKWPKATMSATMPARDGAEGDNKRRRRMVTSNGATVKDIGHEASRKSILVRSQRGDDQFDWVGPLGEASASPQL